MSAPKFTPGPWLAGMPHDREGSVTTLSKKSDPGARSFTPIADVINTHNEEGRANLRLIAAAPSMYAVLQKVAEHFEGIDSPLGDAVRLVLSQAAEP